MISNLKAAFSQGIHESSTTQKELLGTLRVLADGRKFRYVKAGGALAVGKANIGAAEVANHINLTVDAAAAVGTVQIEQTVGATAVTADQYAGGVLQVNDLTGEGAQYSIESNTAAASSGTTILQLGEPIRVALDATSQVSLLTNVYSGVTQSATEENFCVGVSPVAVASGSYGWSQTGGQANALQAGTIPIGAPLTLGAVAGSVSSLSTTIATTVTQPILGHKTHAAGVDTEYAPIMLNLD